MSDTPAPSAPPTFPSAAKPYSTGEPPAKPGNGSGWILAVSLLQFFGGLIMYAVTASSTSTRSPEALGVLIMTVALGIVFFGLWIWGRQSPFPALLTALIVYVTVHLLDAVVDPATILRGFLMKIVILTGLGTALKKAYMAKREKELENVAS